ncbi:MAG: hypothetical protein ACM3YO_04290 [Bacteroidota bacterium]
MKKSLILGMGLAIATSLISPAFAVETGTMQNRPGMTQTQKQQVKKNIKKKQAKKQLQKKVKKAKVKRQLKSRTNR